MPVLKEAESPAQGHRAGQRWGWDSYQRSQDSKGSPGSLPLGSLELVLRVTKGREEGAGGRGGALGQASRDLCSRHAEQLPEKGTGGI